MIRFLKGFGQVVKTVAIAAVITGAGLLLPHQVLAGVNQWTISGPYGAYAYALAISPQYTNDQTLFVGTWGGGVFKTADGGQSWNAANTGLNNLNIHGMAISPNYGMDQTVYAGTYNGVLRSTNGGASWTAVNTSFTNVYTLAVSPNYAVDQTVFAGNGSGAVIKSTNGGTTWTTLNPGIAGTAINGFALSPNYGSDQTLYAATNGKGVYKSTNGGSVWTAAGLALQTVQAVALSPNFAADQTLYAAFVGGVSRTTNGGATWSAVNTGLTYLSYTSLAISPNYATDQTVFVTTLKGIFRTTNGGTGWSAVNTGIRDSSIRCSAISPDYSSDHTLFGGSSGGGINKSLDSGTAWVQANTGLTNLEVRSLAFSPDFASDGTVFAGTWLGENLYKSIDGGATWSGVTLALPASDTVQSLAFSPNYAVDRTLFAGTNTYGVYKSTNGGAAWNAANSGLGGSYIYTLALSPNYANDHTLFAGTMNGLYKSTNGGASWGFSHSGITSYYVNAIALSPGFAVDHVVYAGTTDGAFKSTDGGATWTAVVAGTSVYALAVSPVYTTDHTVFAGTLHGVYKIADNGSGGLSGMGSEQFVSLALSPDFANDQTVFAGSNSGGVYKSTNGGASWSAMNSGLTNLVIQALAASPAFAADQTVFAGTRNTVFSYRNTYPTTEAIALGHPFNTWTSSASVEVTLTARDHSGTGIASGYPQVCIDANNTCTPGAAYQAPVTVTCSALSVCTQYVRYRSADNAGHVETVGSAKVKQDLASPLTTATPAGGTYSTPPSVSLECNDGTGGGCAATYYTMDGSDPTERSLLFTDPITLSETTTLKFRSVDVAGNLEAVIGSETYSLVAGSATLTAGPLRVQVIESAVAFTAAGQGGTGTYEFEFWERRNDATSWTRVQTYSASNTWAWDTTGFGSGSYSIKVNVRCAGSTAAYDAQRTIQYSLVDLQPVTGVLLTGSPASPQMIGQSIGFAATAQGGEGTAEYRYLLKSSFSSTWTTVQEYSPVNTWSWDSGQFEAGTYSVMVHVRNTGSPALYEAVKSLVFSLAAVPPATSVSLLSDIAGPTQRQPLTFTAAAQGGTGVYEYQFRVKGHVNATWTLLREYQGDGICWWFPMDNLQWPAGKYTVQVLARSIGSGTDYDVMKSLDLIVSDSIPATSVDLTASIASPAWRQGVQFTAAAHGMIGPGPMGNYEYQFLVKGPAHNVWTVMRGYGFDNLWWWDPTDALQWPAGKYTIQVMARSINSNTEYDVLKNVEIILADVPPVEAVGLAADRPSPSQRRGTLFTAASQGGTGACEYQFLVKHPLTGNWTVERPYLGEQSGSWIWDTNDRSQWPAGKYTLQVMARSIGSGTEYDAMDTMDYIISDVQPAGSVTLTPDIPSPARRQELHFTASALGGSTGYEYEFLIKNPASSTWQVMGDYQYDGNLWWYPFDAMTWPAGKYTIQVQARSMFGGTEYDVLRNLDFIISDTLPATSVDLVSDIASPALRQPVLLSASAQGGVNNYEYQFLVKGPAGGAWTVLRDYQADWMFWWAPVDSNQWPAGKYTIQVQARSLGSGTEYDVLKNLDLIISDTMPASSVTLTSGKASPAQRQSVLFTAVAGGGLGNYEYRFLVKNMLAGLWTLGRDYQSDGNWWWDAGNTGQWPAGRYSVQVQARSLGSGTEYDVLESMDFIISNNLPASAVSLTSEQSSPARRDTVLFTAAAAGGTGNYEYKFLIKGVKSTWMVEQDYPGGVGTWYWNAGDPYQWPAGKYTVQVQARSLGSGTEYDVLRSVDFTIVDDDPVSAVGLTITNGKKSPAVLATVGTVQFEAAATGTTGNYEYQYLVRNGAGAWTTLRAYDPSPNIDWAPGQTGNYTIQVRARNRGSAAVYEAVRNIVFAVVTDSPVTAVSLAADKTSPVTLGSAGTITFTALATGTTNNYEYQFMVKSGLTGLWSTPRDWGSSGSFPWTPAEAGSYTIQVRARNVGSPAVYEAARSKVFSISP